MDAVAEKPVVVEPEPVVMKRIRFQNLENPGQDLEFNKQLVDYHLCDGQAYNLPEEVVTHLNGISMPRYEFRPNPETGVLETKIVGRIPRFSCIDAPPEKRKAKTRPFGIHTKKKKPDVLKEQ